MAEDRVERRLAAILAADVVGYTRLMEADEEGTRARLQALKSETIDPLIDADGGRVFHTAGDGVLVEFPSAVDAVRNALAMQTALIRRNAGAPADRRIEVRIGINVGDVIVDGDDRIGDGVNLAARLEGLCEPGRGLRLGQRLRAGHRQARRRVRRSRRTDGQEHIAPDPCLPRAQRHRYGRAAAGDDGGVAVARQAVDRRVAVCQHVGR